MAASIYISIEIDDMQNGIVFETEQLGTDSVLAWAETALCPLNKARYRKPGVNARGKPVKGRRDFGCSHGRKSSSKAEQIRPWQRVKLTGCQVSSFRPTFCCPSFPHTAPILSPPSSSSLFPSFPHTVTSL